MANIFMTEEPKTSPLGAFDLPGKPAVVINGVPSLPPVTDTQVPFSRAMENELPKGKGPGLWLEGREVQKLFGDRYYKGEVTKFDIETGWYRVVYEDGDFEDLEWYELERLILPLDISVPLKTLALKIVNRRRRLVWGRGTDRKRGR